MNLVKSPNIKTKLLICEYKEKYPHLSSEEISEMFCISGWWVNKLFKEEYIIIPSKINKDERR